MWQDDISLCYDCGEGLARATQLILEAEERKRAGLARSNYFHLAQCPQSARPTTSYSQVWSNLCKTFDNFILGLMYVDGQMSRWSLWYVCGNCFDGTKIWGVSKFSILLGALWISCLLHLLCSHSFVTAGKWSGRDSATNKWIRLVRRLIGQLPHQYALVHILSRRTIHMDGQKHELQNYLEVLFFLQILHQPPITRQSHIFPFCSDYPIEGNGWNELQ